MMPSRDPYYQDGDRWIELRGKLAGIYQHEVGGGAGILYRIEAARVSWSLSRFPAIPNRLKSEIVSALAFCN
jgi:hypothetical protein